MIMMTRDKQKTQVSTWEIHSLLSQRRKGGGRRRPFRKDKNVHYVTKGKGRHSCCMTALGLGRKEYCDPLTIMLYWIFKGRVKVLMMYKKSMSILLLLLCTFPSSWITHVVEIIRHLVQIIFFFNLKLSSSWFTQ